MSSKVSTPESWVSEDEVGLLRHLTGLLSVACVKGVMPPLLPRPTPCPLLTITQHKARLQTSSGRTAVGRHLMRGGACACAVVWCARACAVMCCVHALFCDVVPRNMLVLLHLHAFALSATCLYECFLFLYRAHAFALSATCLYPFSLLLAH